MIKLLFTVNEEVYVLYGVVGFLLLSVSGVILVSITVIYLKRYTRKASRSLSEGHVCDEPTLPEQACSLVVSSLPGNPLLVWEGVGLRIAACASMHVREHKLHSARKRVRI